MDKSKQSFFRYENGVVIMMFLLFGIVFMERNSLIFMFPFIGEDLGFTNADLGMLVAGLSITWAVSGWVFSSVSDWIGSKKKVLLPATIGFALCSIFSGMATSFFSMLIIRALMGIFEGPVQPIAQATILSESTPSRRGFNAAFMQSSVGLIGATLTPLLVTALAVKYSWNIAFYLVGIPGLIIFFVLMKYMRDPKVVSQNAETGEVVVKGEHKKITRADYMEIFKNRNTLLCTVISALFMTWLFVFTSFAPTFLTARGYTPGEMSLIMAAIGLGSFIFGFSGGWISDRIGRKPTLIVFSLLASLSPVILALVEAPVGIMMLLGFLTASGQACFPLFMVIIPGESIPAAIAASAISITQLVGEIFGGAIMPIIAGFSADAFGLEAPLWIACVGALIATVIAIGLKETAPIKVKKHTLEPTVESSAA